MDNRFGDRLVTTLFGESHGPEIGVVLDGLAPGIDVSPEAISKKLAERRPVGHLSTKRVEMDPFRIVSGVYQGKTTGTPLCILIPNENVKREDYEALAHIARPGHADYTGYVKYHGFNDPSGGGHFSGRLTAPLVAAGAIVEGALAKKGIFVSSTVAKTGDVEKAVAQGDSVGGVIETTITGVPAGVGEPWFGSVEGKLSLALFGIPAIKGVAFGEGFHFADLRGSEANDEFCIQDGKVVTRTNHNGGINGGITNGMDICFQCVVKPTPSIFRKQETVDFVAGKEVSLEITGRHDPSIVGRVRVVVECVSALVVYDLLSVKFGADWFIDKR